MKHSIFLMTCAITVTAHHVNAQWSSSADNSITNTNAGNVRITRDLELIANNNGTSTFGAIRFGTFSGETIASKRTAGGNQFGLDFYTNNINRMSINHDGNVGINNTTPSQKLSVRSVDDLPTTSIAGFLTNNGTQGIGIGHNAIRSIGTNADVNMNFYTKGNGIFTFNTNNNEKIRINNVGDLELFGINSGASTIGALRFGFNSGEAIASKRTTGGNLNGLDFYTNSNNRMSITNSGNVGIGTTTPNRKLQVNGDFRLTSTSGTRFLEFLRAGSGAGQEDWRFEHNTGSLYLTTSSNDFSSICFDVRFGTCSDAYKFTVFGNALASGGTWQNSDLKLKRDINDFNSAMDIIRQLKPKTYFYKSGEYLPLNLPTTQQYGFVAQDLEKVLPSLVQSSDQPVRTNAKGERKMEEIKSVNYTALIPILTKAIQEQQQQIEELKQIIFTLQKGQSSKEIADGASSKINVIASDVILEQNNPNPFTNVTSIRYYVPASIKNAQLIVNDNLGKTIKQVTLSPGKGVVNLDASVLRSGSYNYSLLVDGKKMGTKQMILAR